jgi:hypothetical protein
MMIFFGGLADIGDIHRAGFAEYHSAVLSADLVLKDERLRSEMRRPKPGISSSHSTWSALPAGSLALGTVIAVSRASPSGIYARRMVPRRRVL